MSRLQAYFDGELDAASALEFERHLQSCAGCTVALSAERALRNMLVEAQLYECAPASLRGSVGSQLGAPRPAVTSDGGYWKWLAVAATLLFAISSGILTITLWREHQARPELAAAAVDAHLRSLQQGHLADVQSSDQHTVKPWFDGRVDFAPKVNDFSAQGYPLLGGRLDVLNGRTVAALVYGRRKHIMNVFIVPEGNRGVERSSGERLGYNWLAWRSGSFDYVAVTDASGADLDELRLLLDKP